MIMSPTYRNRSVVRVPEIDRQRMWADGERCRQIDSRHLLHVEAGTIRLPGRSDDLTDDSQARRDQPTVSSIWPLLAWGTAADALAAWLMLDQNRLA